jgi:hypothetical protein
LDKILLKESSGYTRLTSERVHEHFAEL